MCVCVYVCIYIYVCVCGCVDVCMLVIGVIIVMIIFVKHNSNTQEADKTTVFRLAVDYLAHLRSRLDSKVSESLLLPLVLVMCVLLHGWWWSCFILRCGQRYDLAIHHRTTQLTIQVIQAVHQCKIISLNKFEKSRDLRWCHLRTPVVCHWWM